jgi:hypothetical protein
MLAIHLRIEKPRRVCDDLVTDEATNNPSEVPHVMNKGSPRCMAGIPEYCKIVHVR